MSDSLPKINYILPVNIFKEQDTFVAYTQALDLSTVGKTFDEVKKNFTEAVQIFFKEIIEKGTLEEVLKDYGWQKVNNQFFPPVQISNEPIKVSISGTNTLQ